MEAERADGLRHRFGAKTAVTRTPRRITVSSPSHSESAPRSRTALDRALEHPRLGWYLAAIGIVFTLPTLFLGFHLDDFVGRYIYSDLPDARKLYDIMSAGFGVTDGNPEHNHWLIEQGYAPWWTYPRLLIAMFRPVSLVAHWVDFTYLRDQAVLMHAENLLWFGVLILSGTRFYRGVLGPLVGGLAAFLYAFDHTHGFAIGFIANRNALITVALGFLTLDLHHRARQTGRFTPLLFATTSYVLALLAGEMSLAALGYIVAHAVFLDGGSRKERFLAVAPYLAVTMVWRGAYNALGYGAKFCGLYVDPGRDPGRFIRVLFERGPVLLTGELFAPPADLYSLKPEWAPWLAAGAALFSVGFALTLVPLLRRSRSARFWTAGMLFSIVPATTTHPSNRLLFYVGIGAMGLLAELWQLYAVTLLNAKLDGLQPFSRTFGSILVAVHLFVSPLALPFTSASVALASPIRKAFGDVGDDVGGLDLVFVTAPDYYSVRLMAMERRVRGQPLPRRWRVLAYGPQSVAVHRENERTLVLDYDGGILNTPMMELFRDKRLTMAPGETIRLEGLTIRVLTVTNDGRAQRVAFEFDDSLDAPTFRFLYWEKDRFAPFAVPAVGAEKTAEEARVGLQL